MLASKWKHFCKRTNLPPNDKDFRICHLHFNEDCFERDLKYELLPENLRGRKKRLLLPGALPTIFSQDTIAEKESNQKSNQNIYS